MFFQMIFDKNKSQKGASLIMALSAVAITGIIYGIANHNLLNVQKEQKQMLAKIALVDMKKKIDNLCTNIFVLRSSASFNSGTVKNRFEACTSTGKGNCQTTPFEAELYDQSGSIKYAGPESCPALYNFYGAAISDTGTKNVCINISASQKKKFAVPSNSFGQQVYFGVSMKLTPKCPANATSCPIPSSIMAQCNVVSMKGINIGKSLTVEKEITGYSCPPGQVVVGINTNGALICEEPVSTKGFTGDRGPQGPAGDDGPDGVTYSYRRAKDHGCFAAGTKIMTLLGEKNIEDIVASDLVWNPVKGNFQNVNKMVIGPEYKPMIFIKTEDQEIIVTDMHPMSIPNGIKEAGALKANDLILTKSGYQKIIETKRHFQMTTPQVYNIQLVGSSDFNDHYLVANSIVTGDLHIQLNYKKTQFNEKLNVIRNSFSLNEVLHE